MADNEIGKIAVSGGFFLFIGLMSSTIILAVTQIIIARLLGPREMGIYTIILLVPSFLIIVSDFGISSALTKYLSQYKYANDKHKINLLIKNGILFKIVTTSIITCVFIFSNQYVSQLLKLNVSSNLLVISSLYIIGQSILTTINSINIGLDEVKNNCVLLNIQALLRFFISILLIFFGWGILGPVIGIGLGLTITSCIGLIFIFWFIYPKYRVYNNKNFTDHFNLKFYVFYGIPIYLSNFLNAFEGQLRGFLMANFSSDINIGNYSTAFNFGILLNVLATSISSSLFPAFSKIDILKNKSTLESIYKLSVKYTCLFLIPSALLISLLSKDVVVLLYGSLYEKAPIYLSYFMLSYLSTGIGRLVVTPLLNGQGHSRITLKMYLINILSSLIFSIVLIKTYDILGLIISLIISQLLSTLYGVYEIKKRYDIMPPLDSSLKIIISALVSSIIVFIVINNNMIKDPFINVLFNSSIFFIQYLFICPLTGALNLNDVYNLMNLTKGLPFFKLVIKPFIEFEMYILNIIKKIVK